jgi:autotransporter family porin
VQQVRYPYMTWAFNDAISSTAFNLDAALAARRSCFEGYETWLNTVDRGRQYAAGDLWGCVGMWFSGRWYTQPAVDYISTVQSYLSQRIWETPPFISFQG